MVGFRCSVTRHGPSQEILQATFSLVLIIIVFNRFLPFVFFSRTKGDWLVRWAWLLRILIYTRAAGHAHPGLSAVGGIVNQPAI